MDVIENILLAIAPSLFVGIVLAVWEKRQKRRDDRNKHLTEMQSEKDLRLMDLVVATAQLSYATAMAIKRGKPNGEMESALESYEGAMSKFRSFERKFITYADGGENV